MNTEATQNRKIHHGRNVKRLREILGIKQEILAESLGLSQQSVSRLEVEEKIDDEVLAKIAREMNISVEAIKNFDEEKAINIVANTFRDEAIGGYITNCKFTFNPIEKVVELYEQQKELYQQMLKEKEERIGLLEQLLKEKK